MQHSDFHAGLEFRMGEGLWRVTDSGARTVVAIRLDRVEVTQVGKDGSQTSRTLNRAEAEAEGWFRGPPYAVAESVINEDDLVACEAVEK